MVNHLSTRDGAEPELDAIFAALADPTRRAIVARLARGSADVGTVAEPFPISAPAVSRHLRVLERAGLVRRERIGRRHHLHLVPDPLSVADAWLRRTEGFWTERLDALERLLDAPDPDAGG